MDEPTPIPFNRPTSGRAQIDYVTQALRQGRISGDGPFTSACQARLEELLGADTVLLTTSGTHALELSAMLLNVGPGDEVIVPSFTFVSTANAFALRGARLVFADVCSDTFNLDPAHVRELARETTSAIVPVHYAGIACEIDQLSVVAQQCGASIVEDNAHGLFARYGDRLLGTIGRLGVLSFHDTKNFTCGEGGALIVNHPSLVERAEIVREKGTDRSRFFRGEVDKYTWVELGSSYLPSDVLAAVLLAQLDEWERIQTDRERLWSFYAEALADWAKEWEIGLPAVPPECHQSFHMFFLVFHDLEERTRFITHLHDHGIQAVFHYVPLHLSAMGMRFGARPGQCPVSEWISERIVRLPFFTDMTADERDRVADAVRAFRP